MSTPATGNLSALDAAAALTLVGTSRVVEISYISPSAGTILGNFTSPAQLKLSLGTGSRIIEISYDSNVESTPTGSPFLFMDGTQFQFMDGTGFDFLGI